MVVEADRASCLQIILNHPGGTKEGFGPSRSCADSLDKLLKVADVNLHLGALVAPFLVTFYAHKLVIEDTNLNVTSMIKNNLLQ